MKKIPDLSKPLDEDSIVVNDVFDLVGNVLLLYSVYSLFINSNNAIYYNEKVD